MPLLLSSLYAGPSYGQGAQVTHTRPALTPAQIAKAKPKKNTLPRPDTSRIRAESGPVSAPAAVLIEGGDTGTTVDGPQSFGTFGLPYTSTRVALGATTRPYVGNEPNFLNTTYPYRAIGKLTYSGPVGDNNEYHCSATVIRRSVIVTAAHCIQDYGTGGALNRNFQFTPASYFTPTSTAAQDAPYGTWTGRYVVRPGPWANGRDVGDGSAVDNDVAVIVLNKNARGRTISEFTGIIGYASNNYGFIKSPKTGNVLAASTATLGYPGLLDGGNIMQRADGPTFVATIAGAGQLMQGNDFTQGSSGGPWIVNFGAQGPVRSGGAAAGTSSLMAIVGVTSWGAPDPNGEKNNYSSQFRQNKAYPAKDYFGYGAGNIGALVSIACRANSGNGKSYAAMGYC